MKSTDSESTAPGRATAQFLVESQSPVGQGTASGFLRAARHIAEAYRTTDLLLIDGGVGFAVDAAGEVAGVLDAGGRVWVDEVSLAERGIEIGDLAPGVVVAALDAVADPMFDPDVRVVWH